MTSDRSNAGSVEIQRMELAMTRSAYQSPFIVSVFIFIMSATFGIGLYAFGVSSATSELQFAYRKADAISDLLARQPQVGMRPLDAATPDSGIDSCTALLFVILRDLGLHESDATLQEAMTDWQREPERSEFGPSLVYDAMALAANSTAATPPPPLIASEDRPASTLDVIVHMVQHASGGSSPFRGTSHEIRDRIADVFAASFAGREVGRERLELLLSPDLSTDDMDPLFEPDAKEIVPPVSLSEGWSFSGQPIPRGEETARALLDLFGITDRGGPGGLIGNANARPDENGLLHTRVLAEVVARFASALHADDAVKSARRRLVMIRGYEQAGIIIVFVWGLMLLLWRGVITLRQFYFSKKVLDQLQIGRQMQESGVLVYPRDEVERIFAHFVYSALPSPCCSTLLHAKWIDRRAAGGEPRRGWFGILHRPSFILDISSYYSKSTPILQILECVADESRYGKRGLPPWRRVHSWLERRAQLDLLILRSAIMKASFDLKNVGTKSLLHFNNLNIVPSWKRHQVAWHARQIDEPVIAVRLNCEPRRAMLRCVVTQRAWAAYLCQQSVGFRMLCEIREELRLKGSADPTRLSYVCGLVRRIDGSSRWLLVWLSQALPAIGFIGTVRGIMEALGSADGIVRESTAVGQSAAVTDVAGLLALSFATTFIALILGLILSFMSDKVTVEERRILERVERRFASFLNQSNLEKSTPASDSGAHDASWGSKS